MAEWELALPRLKAAYQAWHDSKGKSIDTWLELCADRMDFRSLAAGQHGVPWTRTRTSREEVRGYLSELTAGFTMEHYTVERFVCEDDTIVMIGITAWRNIATGKRVQTPKVDLWRFKNGKAVTFFEFYDTAAVAGAARPA
ncbi:MAG: nuclear transport factor 2 family protein [Alphaproteobacteria bacterium]|nr:nuclear transport factor 2 family protein [Alphaproteobacteria bacterium]